MSLPSPCCDVPPSPGCVEPLSGRVDPPSCVVVPPSPDVAPGVQLPPLHTGPCELPAHSASLAQGRQLSLPAVSQTGVGLSHSESFRHWTHE